MDGASESLSGRWLGRWVALARSLPEAAFSRVFVHPERGRVALGANLAMYAWHGSHHAAHITGLRQRSNWA